MAKDLPWYKRHESDTGSPEYQIWVLTQKITRLQEHLKQNHKDFSAKRCLLKLVARRRQHLKYLKQHNLDIYLLVSKHTKLKV